MIFFYVLFHLLSPKPNYCDCIPLPPIDDKQYNQYDLIVSGKIFKTTNDNSGENIYLLVDTCFKGHEKNKIIKIISPSTEGMCGIFPKKGETWLMFAYTEKKNYLTNLCTRTKNMNPKA